MEIDSKKMEEKTEDFYNNLQVFHNKVNKILGLIIDYFENRGKPYEPVYVALRLKDNKIVDSNVTLTKTEKIKIENWMLSDEKKELDKNIYKIELKNKIMFCKMFKFDNNNLVLAGYSLKETISVRTFMNSFTEKKIREKYERILNII